MTNPNRSRFTLSAPKAVREQRRHRRKLVRAIGKAKARNLQGEELRMFVVGELSSTP